MRLIDADALIKDIDYSADMGGALGRVVECVKLYAKYMIATAPTIEPQQWIPCKRELPKERQEVMVTVDDGYQRYTDTDEYIAGTFWNHGENTVVAWKPLDEPWRGEQT